MAELAVTDGLPPPDDLPAGDFICTSLPDGSIRIDQADPRILISAELLDSIVRGDMAWTWLDMAACIRAGTWSYEPIPLRATYVGALLRIYGVNQQVIYRITSYVPRVNAYIGEWPD
jgi:hypothetical protein